MILLLLYSVIISISVYEWNELVSNCLPTSQPLSQLPPRSSLQLGSDTMGSAPAKVISTSVFQRAAEQGGHSWSLASSLLNPEVIAGTREQWQGCGGRVQRLCSPEAALLRWKETWQAGYWAGRMPCTHTDGPDLAVGLEEVSDGILRTDRHCVALQNKLQQAGWAELWGAATMLEAAFMSKPLRHEGGSQMQETQLMILLLWFTSLTHPLPGHILQILCPSKTAKFIFSWYFAFSSQLLLLRLWEYSGLTLSSARDFLLWFLAIPLRIWPAGEISG